MKAAAQEEDDGPQHQPIIDLPDLVEVKTGEEDEEVREKFCVVALL